MQLKRGASPVASLKMAGRQNPASNCDRVACESVDAIRTGGRHAFTPSIARLCRSRRPDAGRPRARRRQARGNPHRLGDLQSGLHGAQGQGPAGKGIRQGRHRHPLGADARLQQGAGIPQCRLDRFRLDRRLRGAARQDQRQSDQVDLRLFAPGMDRAGDAQGHADQQDRGSQGQARRGDPRHRSAHLPGARAAHRSADREGHHAGAAAASRRQDRADPRRRRCLGRARSDDGGGRGRGRRAAVLSQQGGQHLGHPQCRARSS